MASGFARTVDHRNAYDPGLDELRMLKGTMSISRAALLGAIAISCFLPIVDPASPARAQECIGENCMPAQDSPEAACKGENCMAPQNKPEADCRGENCVQTENAPVEECRGDGCAPAPERDCTGDNCTISPNE
jgi:hypothetical protein